MMQKQSLFHTQPLYCRIIIFFRIVILYIYSVETSRTEVIISCQFSFADIACDYCNKSTYGSFKVTLELALYCIGY